MRRLPTKTIISRVIIVFILIIMLFVMLYPLYLIFNLSMMTTEEFQQNPSQFVPIYRWSFENLKVVLKRTNAVRSFINTVVLGVSSTVINCVISVMAAFPISRNHFKSSAGTYTFILASMFFPGSLVANIILMKDVLFVYGSPLCLVVMWGLGGLALNVFMMVGFVKQLPQSLDEAAFIDGCGYFRYLFQMAMPLMLPIVSTVFTFKLIGCWNDFLSPMIYLKKAEFRPLAVVLYYFKGTYSSKWNQLSAAILLVSSPMVVLYIFMQKYIIEGMTSGALKG